MRLVYAEPQDREFRADYAGGIWAAFVDIQSWYRGQVDGRTFSLFRSSPESCRLPQPADAYRLDTWSQLMTDVQACAPVAYDSPSARWVLYADVVHACNAPGRIGAALRGVAILGRVDLEGLIGHAMPNDCGTVDQAPIGRWIGGAAHELGHMFGLPHPPGCSEGLPTCDRGSLMWLGFRTYPNAYLSEEEKNRLRTSPFCF